jgi:hypothetical protein
MIINSIGTDEIDHDTVESFEWDEVWYDYESGYYDGGGAILARKGDQFVLFDLSHCSCNGPEDALDMYGKKWEGYDELWGRLSEGNRKCCGTVFVAAKKYKKETA